MSTKVQYIEKKRNKYWFVRAIPKEHKNNPFFARQGKNYRKNLETDSLSIAIKRRDQILALWDKAINGNPRDIYKITRESFKPWEDDYISDSDLLDLHRDQIIREWEKKYPLDEGGHPIGVSERDEAVLIAIQDMAEGKNEENRYPLSLMEAAELTAKVKQQTGTNPKDAQKYIRAANYLEAFLGGAQAVNSITYAMAREFKLSKLGEKKTQKTVKGYMTCLSQIWEEAQALGEIPYGAQNPFLKHKLKDDSIPFDALDRFQVQLILNQELQPEDRLLYLMGYYTGARASELIALDRSHIVEKEIDDGNIIQCLSIAKKTESNRRGGKTDNATRTIPIHSKLLPWLKDFNGFETTYDAFTKRRKKLFVELFGKDSPGRIVFHSLRHNFITQVVNLTGSDLIAQNLTGHSTKGSGATARYYHGAGLGMLAAAIENIPEV